MKNAKVFLIAFFLLTFQVVFAQKSSILLKISPTFAGNSFNLTNQAFETKDTTGLRIDVLKFYISNLRFYQNSKIVLEEKNRFHLIDAAHQKSMEIAIESTQKIDFNAIKFDIGIDSATNVSGALGGDLDPTKGMYWTWQSGYINFKIEGTSNLCTSRNHEFQYHLGGYMQPNYALQTVSLPVKNTETVVLNFDIKAFLQQVNLAKTSHIMSPSIQAVSLAKVVAHSFTVIEN